MLVACVIDHQVHEQSHAALVTTLDEVLHVRDRAILLGDAVIIRDIVPHVDLWRFVGWTQPDNIHSEVFDVVELGNDPGYIANAIIV